MNSYKQTKNVFSWLVFGIALITYYLTAERTGSLWDCGEFILGAYKLEVVHPPGAPLFMIIGRLFTWVASIVSSDPANIAFSVNLMSGICTAFVAFFVARIAMIFGRMILVGKDEESDPGTNLALGLAGLAAGLSTAFCSSIWFSAVEGEVYAMSTMFTAMTFWLASKWYEMPDTKDNDRWLVLAAYSGGLSIGVHLLSLLTFPAIGVMYYMKKHKDHNFIGLALSFIAGSAFIIFIQKFVIVGIPTLWKNMEMMLVNGMGMPFHSGLYLALIIVAALSYFLLRWCHKRGNHLMQLIAVSCIMSIIAFSSIGVIVIRANADTPVNMNVPSDAMRLLPYLNREQYGERPLLRGPHFDAQPEDVTRSDRYGRVGDKYEIINEKLDYIYANRDKMIFPRVGHTDGSRPTLHRRWYKALNNGKELKGKAGLKYNLQFFTTYQLGWMYWRYFMWNFSGRQNGEQGFQPWDVKSGHWISGIKPLDEMRLHNMDELSDTMRNHKATNKYYMLPFLFGLIGLFFHLRRRPKDFLILLTLFMITGIGIILYSNQPPNEPRERDYVLVGSFFTYCIWIGLAVLAIFDLIKRKMSVGAVPSAAIAGVVVLIAPIIMAFQNFDDHDRSHHYASRDYASNFLNSVDENAIIFTYGDNDTYPLWYAQEVENIRRDVRVVNLSLIAVDWYIDKLRNKVNDSPPLNLSLSSDAYRGNRRNQVFFFNPNNREDLSTPVDIHQELAFIGNKQNMMKGQTIMRTRNLRLKIDPEKARKMGMYTEADSANVVSTINISLPQNSQYILKDQLAVLDVIASNIHDRSIYFAVTCKNDKLLGLNDYMKMEGLGLRLTNVRNNSDKTLSIYGSGVVETDKAYENIMTKWKWGNFDKEESFITSSYAAEVQAMKIVMMRTAEQLLKNGQKEKALNVARKYFEGFPHFNFPYDDSVVPFINIMIENEKYEEAKKHIRILATEASQNMAFIASLDDEDFNSFKSEFGYNARAVTEVMTVSSRLNDPAFRKEMDDLVGDYDLKKMSNPNKIKG